MWSERYDRDMDNVFAVQGIVNFSHGWQSTWMSSPAPSYHGYRFPPDIIAHAVWLYFRFSLSFRDVEGPAGPAGHHGHL